MNLTIKNHHPRLISLIIFLALNLIVFSIKAQIHNWPVEQINGVDCYVYTVQKSEGFFRISRNFETTEAIIRSFNPTIGDTLHEGMKIYIPVNQSAKENPNIILHTVEKRQTIFGICRLYNITEAMLIEMNPHLVNNSIREGEILKIPIPQQVQSAIENKTSQTDTTKRSIANIVNTTIPRRATNNNQDTLRIAYLLPFLLDQRTEPSDSRFIEFYAGSLVAMREAKNRGMNFEIFNYDTEKSDVKLMEVLQKNDLGKMDLIIGPAYASQVSVIGDYARIHQVKTLIPFTSRVLDLDINPFLFQFNPNQDVEIHKLQEILSLDAANINIIFADIPNVSNLDEGIILSQSLKNFLSKTRIPYHTVLMEDGYGRNLRQVLHSSKENILIFNTNRINQASVYLRELTQLTAGFEFKIYEPYSWRSSRIEKPKSFYLSFFRDEFPQEAYDDYMRRFGELFAWTPTHEFPRFDLLGYDLTNYFLNTILTKEVSVRQLFPVHEGIQSDIQFEKSTERGGYINKQLYHYE